MEDFQNRRKKKDKAREKIARNGGLNTRHVRIVIKKIENVPVSNLDKNGNQVKVCKSENTCYSTCKPKPKYLIGRGL
jgi:hypothetical protein